MHTMVPSPACIKDVLKVKVEVKGHVIGTLSFQYNYQAAIDLMSKSWNELLRH